MIEQILTSGYKKNIFLCVCFLGGEGGGGGEIFGVNKDDLEHDGLDGV